VDSCFCSGSGRARGVCELTLLSFKVAGSPTAEDWLLPVVARLTAMGAMLLCGA